MIASLQVSQTLWIPMTETGAHPACFRPTCSPSARSRPAYGSRGRPVRPGPIATFALPLLLGFLFPLGAQPPSAPLPSDPNVPGEALRYFRDPSNQMTFAQIAALPERSWQEVPGGVPSFGFTRDTLWLRISMRNDSSSREFVLEFGYPLLDHVQVYMWPTGAARSADPEEVCIGDQHPLSRREVQGRMPAAIVAVPPGTTQVVYAAVRTETTMQFPLRVFPREVYAHRLEEDSLIHGLYFGLMVSMMAFNLFVASTSRSLTYVFYVGYVLFSTLFFFCVQGLAVRYSFPPGTFWRNEAVPAYLGAFTLFICLFTMRFLRTEKYAPGGRRVLLAMAGYELIAIALSFFVPYRFAAAMLLIPGVVMPFLLLPIAIICWKRGFPAARYFVLAWVLLLFAYAHRVLTMFAILPADPFWIEYGVLIATGVEATLLAMALGDRMRFLQKQQAQLASLQHEIELARGIQESLLPRETPQVAGLEINVRHRSMAEVGGDFYDFRTTEHGVGVLLADVSGHGVPAALVVSVVKTGFWFQSESLTSPHLLLASMSDILNGKIGEEFVTASYFYYDEAKGRVFVGNAGHPPLLLQKAGEAALLEVRPLGRVLGLQMPGVFQTESYDLKTGDRILMYTDGVFEQTNPRGELFGTRRLHEYLMRNRSMDGGSLARGLMDEVTQWAGGAERLDDDVAILVADGTATR